MRDYTAAEYLTMFQDLLPQGAAWTREQDAQLTALLAALAVEAWRVDVSAHQLMDAEALGSAAYSLLEEWEELCGLPDTCTGPTATTLSERRAAVKAKLSCRGGQSVAYFQALAVGLGYSVTIEEFRPFICGVSCCGEDVLNGGHEVRLYWRVHVHGPRVTRFRCGESCPPDQLAKITAAQDLECLLRRYMPAHTTLIFAYEEA